MSDENNKDISVGMLAVGIGLMVVASLLLIFTEVGIKEACGIAALGLIGLGLTVAATPDPRKET